MPYRSKIPCRHPGCPNLIPYGQKYCDAHNIDFQTYLTEKEKAEAPDFEPVSTEEAFKTISNEIK